MRPVEPALRNCVTAVCEDSIWGRPAPLVVNPPDSVNPMSDDISNEQLIGFATEWHIRKPHVVILGAGASLAAFPKGDASGRRLPLMENIVDILDLGDVIAAAKIDPNSNFEDIYSALHERDPQASVVLEIEKRVASYFENLEQPAHPTLYDLLLLSLREKDAIFTFNWDPFLVDAYNRNHGKVPLPKIFHLHGNVRISYCETCGVAQLKKTNCHRCGTLLIPSRLLYPIKVKNYADDCFIATQWERLQDYVKNAVFITIFGYSAPKSDQEAMAIFRKSWKVTDPETRPVHRVEVIDVKDRIALADQWCPFAHFPDHIDFPNSFFDSFLARYPRRTCEALANAGFDGKLVKNIPWAGSRQLPANIGELWKSVFHLSAAEKTAE